MGGLLAPSGRQDGPKRPPSGPKTPQEAARRPLRACFLESRDDPKSPRGHQKRQKTSYEDNSNMDENASFFALQEFENAI